MALTVPLVASRTLMSFGTELDLSIGEKASHDIFACDRRQKMSQRHIWASPVSCACQFTENIFFLFCCLWSLYLWQFPVCCGFSLCVELFSSFLPHWKLFINIRTWKVPLILKGTFLLNFRMYFLKWFRLKVFYTCHCINKLRWCCPHSLFTKGKLFFAQLGTGPISFYAWVSCH